MANTRPMGIGVIGKPDVNFKRKFRFTFELQGFCNNEKNRIPEHFVKIAARPNLEIEEQEVPFLNGIMWEPGRARWQAIDVTYYDVAHETKRYLFNWLATVYDYSDPVNLRMGKRRDWEATGVINMYDGCGNLLEQWQLQHVWPTNVNWGDLSYEDSGFAEISLTLRYSDVRYKSFCPEFVPQGCCTPCNKTATSVA